MTQRDPVFGAAVVKLQLAASGLTDAPGALFVYRGVLRELGVTEEQVDAYIAENRDRIEAHLRARSQ